jgi:hypothetical protein
MKTKRRKQNKHDKVVYGKNSHKKPSKSGRQRMPSRNMTIPIGKKFLEELAEQFIVASGFIHNTEDLEKVSLNIADVVTAEVKFKNRKEVRLLVHNEKEKA